MDGPFVAGDQILASCMQSMCFSLCVLFGTSQSFRILLHYREESFCVFFCLVIHEEFDTFRVNSVVYRIFQPCDNWHLVLLFWGTCIVRYSSILTSLYQLIIKHVFAKHSGVQNHLRLKNHSFKELKSYYGYCEVSKNT